MGKMFLVIVDSYSKWVEVFPVSNFISQTTINCLRTCFATHGLSQICVSENRSCFTSEEFECFMKNNRILLIKSAPAIWLKIDAQKDLLELLKTLSKPGAELSRNIFLPNVARLFKEGDEDLSTLTVSLCVTQSHCLPLGLTVAFSFLTVLQVLSRFFPNSQFSKKANTGSTFQCC